MKISINSKYVYTVGLIISVKWWKWSFSITIESEREFYFVLEDAGRQFYLKSSQIFKMIILFGINRKQGENEFPPVNWSLQK